MIGTYDPWLVTLSMVVAVMSSYVALDLGSRVTANAGRAAHYWLASGAASMGMGIWSMHFIAMLAFSLPMPMAYDVPITALSLLIAMLVSGFALHTVSRVHVSWRRLGVGGVLMGLGIAAMHYTGMAAMQMDPPLRYHPGLFALSIIVAIGAALAALWIAFRLREETILSGFWLKAGSAVLMGAAICGMHYTGMAATIFSPHTMPTSSDPGMDSSWMAVTIGAFTVTLLATTLLVSISDARRAREVSEHRLGAERLKQSHLELEERVRERTAELALTNAALESEIAERKRAEKKLAQDGEFLTATLNSLAEGIVACDESGTLNMFNRATREFHGLPEEALPSEQWSEHYGLLLPDGETPLPADQIPLARAFQGELVRDVEIVIAPKDLPRRVLVCNGQAMIDADGRKLGAVVAMHDITERKRVEAALEASRRNLVEKEQRLAEAQHIAHVGSWEWDVVRDRITWSDELFSLYQIDPQEFVPTYESYLSHVHPEDVDFVRHAVDAAFQEQAPFRFEHRFIRKDGSVGVMQSRGQVVVEEGRTIAMRGTGQDVTEIKEAERQLRQLAHFDSLTGLPNRREFYESLGKAMAQADEENWLVAVLFLDLDRFKNVNDTLGHIVGDELLRHVGSRLLGCLRMRDTVGRLGGDEFGLILVMPPDPQIAAKVATKALAEIRKSFLLDGREVSMGASIGITVYPTDARDIDTLMKFADTAMYAAKEGGRDTFRFYTAEMNARAMDRLELETALRWARERNEFVLHYQPKISLADGRWIGSEALLRWQRPGHGLVAPAEFIPALEDSGQITQVGSWVINAACRQIAEWRSQGIAPRGIALNVSGKQVLRGPINRDELANLGMQQSFFAESQELEFELAKAIREHAIGPELLEFELTESTLMVHADQTVSLLHRLKAQGIRISIDDFGTGYSSLSYLKRFPIDTVKIDRSFVRDITTNFDDAAIATAIIRMAHSLKLRVVAEGVETREQLELLCELGCDEAQGYYIAMPMPADQLAELFQAGEGPAHVMGQDYISLLA